MFGIVKQCNDPRWYYQSFKPGWLNILNESVCYALCISYVVMYPLSIDYLSDRSVLYVSSPWHSVRPMPISICILLFCYFNHVRFVEWIEEAEGNKITRSIQNVMEEEKKKSEINSKHLCLYTGMGETSSNAETCFHFSRWIFCEHFFFLEYFFYGFLFSKEMRGKLWPFNRRNLITSHFWNFFFHIPQAHTPPSDRRHMPMIQIDCGGGGGIGIKTCTAWPV